MAPPKTSVGRIWRRRGQRLSPAASPQVFDGELRVGAMARERSLEDLAEPIEGWIGRIADTDLHGGLHPNNPAPWSGQPDHLGQHLGGSLVDVRRGTLAAG